MSELLSIFHWQGKTTIEIGSDKNQKTTSLLHISQLLVLQKPIKIKNQNQRTARMLHYFTSPRLATANKNKNQNQRTARMLHILHLLILQWPPPPLSILPGLHLGNSCDVSSLPQLVPFVFSIFLFLSFIFFSILLKRRQEPPKKNHKAKSLRWCSSWIQYSASSWVGCMFEKQRILHNNCESPLKLWIWSKYDQTFEIWSKLCIKHCLAFTESTNERPWLLQC